MVSSSLLSFSSNGSLSSGSPSSSPRKMRSINELYEVTTPIDNDVTLYYHLAVYDPIVFKEAIKNAKQRISMDEEITSIEKNDT